MSAIRRQTPRTSRTPLPSRMPTRKLKQLIQFMDLFSQGGLPGTRPLDQRLRTLFGERKTLLRNELALRDARDKAKAPKKAPSRTATGRSRGAMRLVVSN